MSDGKKDNPKTFIKRKEGQSLGFRSPSRFSGGGLQAASNFGKSQFRPIPPRITQHKG